MVRSITTFLKFVKCFFCGDAKKRVSGQKHTKIYISCVLLEMPSSDVEAGQ